MSETILKVHKDTTLTEATRMAHTVGHPEFNKYFNDCECLINFKILQILGLEGTVPLSSCRLIKYDDSNDSLECSFEGSEDKSIVDLLGGTKSNYRYSLLLEVWPPDKQAPVYRPGG